MDKKVTLQDPITEDETQNQTRSPLMGFDDNEGDLTISSGKSWSQRTFGKMLPGSLRGSVFTMVSTAIGAGCLSLPLVFSYLGIIIGPFFLLLGMSVSYLGIYNIAIAAEHYKIYQYSSLIGKAFGKVRFR